MDRFSGFPPDALAFYEGLAADNSKAYFDAHRQVYETSVREPLELLLFELAPEFGTGKVFRPHRDVRFSKDKSPYKLVASAVLSPDGAACTAHYVELSPKGLRLGGGMWEPDRGQLERLRRAIDDDATGGELAAIADGLASDGVALYGAELKTAPRGFAKDHPRIDLLRRKRLAAMVTHAPGPWLQTREALDRVVAGWRTVAPLQAWLERHVGPRDPVDRDADPRRRPR
jgi:uncharacterized protein (TIGR02453 family)